MTACILYKMISIVLPIIKAEEKEDDEGCQADGQSRAQGVDPNVIISSSFLSLVFVIVVPVAVELGSVLGAFLGRRFTLGWAVGVAVTSVRVAVASPVGVGMTVTAG